MQVASSLLLMGALFGTVSPALILHIFVISSVMMIKTAVTLPAVKSIAMS